MGKAIDDVVDIDLHVAVHVQHRESIEPLLAAAGAQKRLHAAQSADTSLTSTSRNREDTQHQQQCTHVRESQEASPLVGDSHCALGITRDDFTVLLALLPFIVSNQKAKKKRYYISC